MLKDKKIKATIGLLLVSMMIGIASAQILTAKDTAIISIQTLKIEMSKTDYAYVLDDARCGLDFKSENVIECRQYYHLAGKTAELSVIVDEKDVNIMDANLDAKIQANIKAVIALESVTYKP